MPWQEVLPVRKRQPLGLSSLIFQTRFLQKLHAGLKISRTCIITISYCVTRISVKRKKFVSLIPFGETGRWSALHGGTVTDEHIQAFQTSAVPIVLCATRDEKGTYPSVDIDHETAAFDAVNTLIRHGHREIAMISGTLQDPANGYARFHGYKKALEQAGIEYQEDLVRIGNYRYESGVEAMKYFLGLKKKPTAIFAATDEMAIGAIHSIQDEGLKVPDDFSIISVDNIRMASMVRPLLTTVAQPMYDLGAVAMRL